jgi:hypothetical protein
MPVLFAPTGHKNKVVKTSPLVTEGSIAKMTKYFPLQIAAVLQPRKKSVVQWSTLVGIFSANMLKKLELL